MEDENCGIGEVEEDPALKTQEDVATREKPGTPGECVMAIVHTTNGPLHVAKCIFATRV